VRRMAKKKKKEPKEIFKEPEFDEVEFMKGEMDNAKAGIITIIYAIPIAIISFELTIIGLAILGFMVGIIAILSLRFLYTKLGVNLKSFEKKTWLGNGALMFFCWLLFWILLLNPPFSDNAAPTIGHVEIWEKNLDGTWTKQPIQYSGGKYVVTVSEGANIKIKANITDNSALDSVTIAMVGGAVWDSMNRNNTYEHNYEREYILVNQVSEYTLRAVDQNGNVKEVSVVVSTQSNT
jgi:hypothetical protein